MTVERMIRIIAGLFIMISLALGVEGSPLFVSKWALAEPVPIRADQLLPPGHHPAQAGVQRRRLRLTHP